MNEASKAIMSISRVSGRNDKLALLQKYAETEYFKPILQFIYNPYVRTGIAKAKLKKAVAGAPVTAITPLHVIEYFSKHQTGASSDTSFALTFVNQFEPGTDEYEVAVGMVTKTLKIGVTAKSLNKVYGDNFIPMIGIMKAEKYQDFKDRVKGPFIVTEKLDGARRILVKENGNITLYSRSGIPDDGLVEIEEEAKYLPDNCVYDGELLAVGKFKDSIELRQATNSIANRKGTRTGLTFNVFDLVPLKDFKSGVSKHGALVRKTFLSAMFGDESIECLTSNYKSAIAEWGLEYQFKHIKVVPILGIAATESDILSLARPIWDRGFEGVMLNTYEGKYDLTKDRSRDILKVKLVKEIVLPVVDVEEGEGKNIGRVGALVVYYKGEPVGVGSGLTDQQRIDWWNNKGKIIGKSVEIEYFGESKNQQGTVSLNCPIFKRVAGSVD